MDRIPCLILCLADVERVGQCRARVLVQTGAYFVMVLLGLAVHALLTLPLILRIFTKRNRTDEAR